MPPSVKKEPRVLFLFSSPREKIIADVKIKQGTDTPLRGWNYISGAEYIAIGERRGRQSLSWLSAIIPRSIRSLVLVPRLLRYNFIIAQDDLLLGYIISQCAWLLRLKTRWLYIAINSSTLMRRRAASPWRLFFLKRLWSSYSRIICLSSEQLNDFKRLGISPERLIFIPFGIDTDFFKDSEGVDSEDFILSVGRDLGRDYETLFRAAALTEYKFVVVAAQHNISADQFIPANVSVLYNQSLTTTKDLYARARLVVVPSKNVTTPEGSDCSGQTVVLDALATNKAVIATHRPWITDYFIPGQDLITVEPNDPYGLAEVITMLWQNKERRQQLAQSGHDKVVTRYTTKVFAESLVKLMNSII